MMRSLGWGAVVSGLVLAAMVFAPTPLRDRLYREVSYQFLADRITAGAKTDEERAIRLFEFVHLQVNVVGAQVVDDNPWNDLVRGIGWCDQQSWDLATLLSKQNVHARFAMLRKADGVSPHTVAEVRLGERWVLFDQLNGLYYHKPDGELATLEEVTGDVALIAAEPKIQQLTPEIRDAFLGSIAHVYPTGQEPTRWSSLLLKKNRSTGQRLANQTIQIAVRTLGAPFAHAYQDLYYLAAGPARSAEARFRRARNYHLYDRLAQAEHEYRSVAEQAAQEEPGDDAQFYLAVVLHEQGRYGDSLAELDRLSRREPASRWHVLLPYYQGRNHEAAGDWPQAIAAYGAMSGNLDVDAAWRLHALAGKVRTARTE